MANSTHTAEPGKPPITNWDDAYANGAYIPEAENYPQHWTDSAQQFRDRMLDAGAAQLDITYGEHPRERYDLFHPISIPPDSSRGLIVFVHGGYWMRFDKSYWSHLANGATENGWSVMMPSYTLCPETSIAGITQQIGRAISQAARAASFPLRLAGHSAGGHLVSRMMCQDSPLESSVINRLEKVVSISGVHDLRPLLKTQLNDKLQLDNTTAIAESPALQTARAPIRLCCCAGSEERPEFLRQNALLANIWRGSGIETECIEIQARHHFNIIDDLAKAESTLTARLLAQGNDA